MSAHSVPAVHSLLRLSSADALEWESEPPQWVPESLRRAPFVVMRRPLPRLEAFPVGIRGIRGGARSQRAAAWVPVGAVRECITPQMLAARHAWRQHRDFAITPAVAALEEAAMIFDGHGLAGRWGPAGSAGFELASGVPTTTPNSDLDIVLDAAASVAPADAARLQAELSALTARVDVLLETPNGAVALAEYTKTAGAIMLRSPQGPRLVRDPWRAHLEAPPEARQA
jgi:phosphoribosyl-dephospho-CoA transferase